MMLLASRIRPSPAIFTSAENLPFANQNDHSWVTDFCQSCLVCVQKCPPQAILEQPRENGNGLVTCTVDEKCFPYFMDNYGCSICIRVCPFQSQEYATLKRDTFKKLGHGAG